MIDPHAARILRAAAAQHIVEATKLEAIETARPGWAGLSEREQYKDQRAPSEGAGSRVRVTPSG
jgi:hypothetical protein